MPRPLTIAVAAAMLACARAQCESDCKLANVTTDPNTNAPANVLNVGCAA